jgi:hypothetical protein
MLKNAILKFDLDLHFKGQGNQKSSHIWPLTESSRSNRGRFVDFGLKMSVTLKK